MRERHFEFVTDTAMLCVFDVAALQHRLADDCDWWTVPADELAEVNKGNVACGGLPTDGKYAVNVTAEPPLRVAEVALVLNCPSGRVFVGAGEEVTANGSQPRAMRGGAFLKVRPGTYRLTVGRSGEDTLLLHLGECGGVAVNHLKNPVRL
jgi:hypothetical protein